MIDGWWRLAVGGGWRLVAGQRSSGRSINTPRALESSWNPPSRLYPTFPRCSKDTSVGPSTKPPPPYQNSMLCPTNPSRTNLLEWTAYRRRHIEDSPSPSDAT